MSDTPAIRSFEEDGNWYIEGLVMPVGGPLRGQDLTGTHFTKSTDYALDWFPDGGRPGLYRHGFDETLGLSVVGREVKSWKDAKGTWLQAQMDKAHEYASEIKQLLDEKVLSLSSGAVDHLVRIAAKSGAIEVWPWVEWSLVPNPANPEALLYQVKSTDAVAHLTETGTEVPQPVLAIKDEAPDEATLAEILPTVPEGDDVMVSLTVTLKQLEAMTAIEGAIKAIPLTPQALHDAASASGAKCAGEAAEPEPAPVLAIRAGNNVETVTEADLATLRVWMRETTAAAIKGVIG